MVLTFDMGSCTRATRTGRINSPVAPPSLPGISNQKIALYIGGMLGNRRVAHDHRPNHEAGDAPDEPASSVEGVGRFPGIWRLVWNSLRRPFHPGGHRTRRDHRYEGRPRYRQGHGADGRNPLRHHHRAHGTRETVLLPLASALPGSDYRLFR